jgi:hypothetical protein
VPVLNSTGLGRLRGLDYIPSMMALKLALGRMALAQTSTLAWK